ncbi:MAG: hypothetical protein WC757_02190 [Candidatus Paceibacterota bacterium]|jgi:hypothetical protein
MQKDLKNITEGVMDQIHNNKIKMRPRIYFILGSVLTFVGLVSSVIVSIFLVGLMRFSFRSHGPMGSFRLDQMLSNFPWWAPVLAVIGLVAGLWLLRRYDFSFKINFKLIIIGLVLAVIAGGFIIDAVGLNNVLIRRGPMKGIMRQYIQDNNIQIGPGRGWNRGL